MTGRGRSSLLPGRFDGFLVALLIVALLLCHSVLGSAHQVSCHSCEPAGAAGGHHHGAATRGAEGDGGDEQQEGGWLGEVAYAAIVVVAGFAGGPALLGLLRAGGRRWPETRDPRTFGRLLLPIAPYRPRGPTLPSLQVFRL